MSFTDVEDVHLKETDLFAHSSIIKPEIVRFRDKFDYNKLEFDGLIRRNHRIYEANDSFPQITNESVQKLLDNLKRVESRIKLITEVSFSKNDLTKIDLSDLTQMDIHKLAEAKLQECNPVERLDVIREMSVEDGSR